MIPELPEVVSGASRVRPRRRFWRTLRNLEAELAEARPYLPQKPPTRLVTGRPDRRQAWRDQRGSLQDGTTGQIASTKIGSCLWVEPIETRPARKRYKSRY